MKKEDLRKEFGNKREEKVRTERTIIIYNPDYVHFLENKLIKLLSISDACNYENADNAPTFEKWLLKYFEPAKVSKTYKDKIKGSEHTERSLYRKYERAYKNII